MSKFKRLLSAENGFTPHHFLKHKFDQTNPTKSGAGFTMIEVIAAIFVFTMAILALMILIDESIVFSDQAKSKLIAVYLAQEGIEIVHNIRDSNWIKKAPSWDSGLSVGDYEADYQGQSLSTYTGNYLYIDSNGFYSYSYLGGTQTKFKRKITISDKTGDPPRIKITSRVEWEIRGKYYNIEVVEYLYNWK